MVKATHRVALVDRSIRAPESCGKAGYDVGQTAVLTFARHRIAGRGAGTFKNPVEAGTLAHV